LVDYNLGNWIYQTKQLTKKKYLLALSLLVNLGVLGFFKYFNFFIDSFSQLISQMGLQVNAYSLKIILPVGVSFYTFQTLSYTLDIYKGKLKPTRDIIDFFAFVSFFPQLVAGPIERAKNLLPQFQTKNSFNFEQAKEGCKLILWGFFKKIAIADVCAKYVDIAFSGKTDLGGGDLMIGGILFSIQIYCDFSGYSLIARGIAKLLGFELMRNFAYPFFSRNFGEFWKRWHISLSTWFQDYLYIPLGGSRAGKFKQFRNIMITFTVSGLWHGANWTFVFWGFLNGLYYIPLIFLGSHKKYQSKMDENQLFVGFSDTLKILVTFMFTVLAFIFFRAPDIQFAFSYIAKIFTDLMTFQYQQALNIPLFIIIGLLFIFEWTTRAHQHPLLLKKLSKALRWIIYLVIVFITIASYEASTSFIYFQF